MSFHVIIAMAFVVDFQAFKTLSNEFILKELAIVGVNENIVHHFFIKSPSFQPCGEMKARVKYVTKYIHNIPWNYGHVEKDQALSVLYELTRGADVVYVKGSERVEYLRKCMNWKMKIVDLDSIKCPQACSLSSPA